MKAAASERHIAIIGGGFAGTLLAINLMRHAGPRVTLIERHDRLVARGIAYGTAHAEHVLNVRAGNMSAIPDEPDHFVHWLETKGLGDRKTFVPRRVYGAYLREMLDAGLAAHGDRLTLRVGEVVGLDRRADGYRLRFDDGGALDADVTVLALGNLPPHPPAGLDVARLPSDAYVSDPWSGDIARGLGPDDELVLLGTGLTAIDVALSLDAAGFGGQVLALSRRGLRPRAHADTPAPTGLREKPAGRLSGLVRLVRERSAVAGWRAAVDELRPVTQILWAGMDAATRARFLRHLRPYWDVHRHRLAPSVAARVDAMVASGRLRFAAGKLIGTSTQPDGVAVMTWRPRGADAAVATRTRRIVNCTGPQGDLVRSDQPLIAQALADGLIRPDRLRIGVDVDPQSRVIDRHGRVDDRLYCIGPMTRGDLWEVVAVPDIRQQNWTLARRLAHAQWVGGEGL